jgi:hypothetical protein
MFTAVMTSKSVVDTHSDMRNIKDTAFLHTAHLTLSYDPHNK